MKKTLENRRRTYYIKKEFQRAFIIKFCLLVILGALVSGAVIYLVSRGTATTVFENSRISIKSTADFILPAVLLASAVTAVFVGIATVIVTLYASHRIAGPLYRIEKDLERVMAGDLDVKFHLRKNDQLVPLASLIERLTGRLKEDVREMKQVNAELAALLAQAQEKSADGRLAETARRLKELQERLSRFHV